MKHIIVTGIDKAGKTSVINAFMEATNYKHYLVDRDPSTYHALNIIQNRMCSETQLDEYFEFIDEFKLGVDLAVLLYCEPEELDRRFKKHKEPELVGSLSKKDHQDLIINSFEAVGYPNSIEIDTSDISIEQTVNIIKHRLEEIDNANQQRSARTSTTG